MIDGRKPRPPLSFWQLVYKRVRSVFMVVLSAAIALAFYFLKRRKNDQLQMKEEQERRLAQERRIQMEKLWLMHQEKKRTPNMTVTDNQLDEIKHNLHKIKEEDEEEVTDNSEYEIDEAEETEGLQLEQGGVLESELELNERNFNLIKNSKAFKMRKSKKSAAFEDILEDKPDQSLSNVLGNGRKSEEDHWW